MVALNAVRVERPRLRRTGPAHSQARAALALTCDFPKGPVEVIAHRAAVTSLCSQSTPLRAILIFLIKGVTTGVKVKLQKYADVGGVPSGKADETVIKRERSV